MSEIPERIVCTIDNSTRFNNSTSFDFKFANIKILNKFNKQVDIQPLNKETALDIIYSGNRYGCFPDHVGLKPE